MDGDQGLVEAQHDQGEEEPAEDEAGEGTAVCEQPVGEAADGGGDLPGGVHQAEDGDQAGERGP